MLLAQVCQKGGDFMSYFLAGTKELKIDNTKKHRFLVQTWGDLDDPEDQWVLLNVLQWCEEKDGFESLYNVNIKFRGGSGLEIADNRRKR